MSVTNGYHNCCKDEHFTEELEAAESAARDKTGDL